ncbi:MAG: hypothetical protein ACRC8S_16680 [Fimbriiglobus sp.]
MSRTARVVISSIFQGWQFIFSLVAGIIIFPMTVHAIGVESFGLWLASGEVVGYLLLSDLGVFSVLPWLIAAKDGTEDREAIAALVTDGLVVALAICVAMSVSVLTLLFFWPVSFVYYSIGWEIIRDPLLLLLGLSAFGLLFRPFQAVLTGLQDVVFSGWLSLIQGVTSICLTAVLVLFLDWGVYGLAVASGVPPLLSGIAALFRVRMKYGASLRLTRPSVMRASLLLREGLGPWLASFGVRLLAGSMSLVLVGLGRTADATLYAATAKSAQILQNIACILPDNSLIGLTQVRSAGNEGQTRKAVFSILAMYMILSSFSVYAFFSLNPLFVRLLMGDELFAGTVVHTAIGINLIASTLVNGLFKTVGVVAHRPMVGLVTLVYGVYSVFASFIFGYIFGVEVTVFGMILASFSFAFPIGLWLFSKVYKQDLWEMGYWFLTWMLRSLPFFVSAVIIGSFFSGHTLLSSLFFIVLGISYVFFSSSAIADVPWPLATRRILIRTRLIPASALHATS